jgi:hypothetical protein
MHHWSRLFFRERSLSKVAATYSNAAAARSAEMSVKRIGELHDGQIQVVYPFERNWTRKVEPEGVGIWRTAVRAHLSCGIIGSTLGMLAFALLALLEVPAVTSTPLMSLVTMTFFATMLGLMAGGVLTLRPDHERVILAVRDAARKGRWCVVVHPVSRQQRSAALRTLTATGAPITRSL